MNRDAEAALSDARASLKGAWSAFATGEYAKAVAEGQRAFQKTASAGAGPVTRFFLTFPDISDTIESELSTLDVKPHELERLLCELEEVIDSVEQSLRRRGR